MPYSTATSPDAHGVIPVDKTTSATSGIHGVNTEIFDAVVITAGDTPVCVSLWGVDRFNYETVEKAMLAQSGVARGLGLKWLHANAYVHPELDQHFALHGIPVSMSFHRGKKLGRVIGWYGHTQFTTAVASVRNKLTGKSPA